MISLISQCWKECRRLLISRSDDGNRIDGNIIMVTTIGRPITEGVIKEENRFSFILILKGFLFFVFQMFLEMEGEEMIGGRFLVEI